MPKSTNEQRREAVAQRHGEKAADQAQAVVPDAEEQDPSEQGPSEQGSSGVESLELGFSALGFRRRLGAWYRENARELPWRGVGDPYATWLSEIMLQQTRVATVMDRYKEFLLRFPT